jgi:hypothetical protein
MDGSIRRLNIDANAPNISQYGNRQTLAVRQRHSSPIRQSGCAQHIAAKGGQGTVKETRQIRSFFPIMYPRLTQDSPKKGYTRSDALQSRLATSDMAQAFTFVIAQPRASEHLYPSVDHGFVRCCAVTQKQSASGPNI